MTDPSTGHSVPGAYVVGWIKRGASGGIGANRIDAQETVQTLLSDLRADVLTPPPLPARALDNLLRKRNVDVVDAARARKIETAERTRGKKVNRPRGNFATTQEMLRHGPWRGDGR